MRIQLAAAALVTTACVSSGTYKAKSEEADRYQRNLATERQNSSDLRKALEERDARIATMDAQLASLRDKVEKLGGTLSENEKARGRLEAAVADLSESKARLEKTKVELEQERAALQARSAELEKRSSEYEQLATSLKTEIDQGKIELTELKGRMTVKLKDKILFASGSAAIGREGKAALAKVAEAFKDLKGRIVRVEGHTDDRPIGSAVFPSNWELSGARSLAVVRFLQEQGVSPTVLAGAAYSQYRPVAPNDSPDGRSQNRRIEIVLAPAE